VIGRYFGGKEQLFRQVVEHAYADHLMMTPRSQRGSRQDAAQ
jgi:AcrR family transcriptional regulator